MALSEEKLKELDRRLQALSLDNFERFCMILGADRTRGYICMLKATGKSQRTIQRMLNIPKSTVGYICKKCPN